ncbi:MAG TPA: hypothetical protein VFE63_05010 [Roseiarcus sp.]|nr:hypothetical protein [Roseiarcus sp.]
MVDEESQDVACEPAGGAPANRDKRGDPGVIDGEAPRDVGEAAPSAQRVSEPAPSEEAVRAAPPSRDEEAVPPRRTRRGAFAAFLAGALGGLIVAAIGGGAGYYYILVPKTDLAETNARRLASIESQAQRQDAAIAGVGKRVDALEGTSSAGALAAVDKRLDALQSANAEEAPRIAAATQALQALTGEVKDLGADVDAARSEIPGLKARLAKLEAGPPQAAAADLSAVTARIDRIEAQLAAPKSETRVAPEKPSAADNPAAVAIVAQSLGDNLTRGAPFPTELAGLEHLGVEPAKLAALKAVVDGAPTDRALADAFAAVRTKVLAAAAPSGADSGIVDRFVAHLRGLVQVRNLNETTGDDPLALASRIEADSRRGDVRDALAAFAKLPEPSRQAASAWASAAEARQAAEAALQTIRETAVAQLAENGKP